MDILAILRDLFPTLAALFAAYAFLERRLTRLETKVDILIDDRREKKIRD